jgi:hypothetical protein
VTAEDYHFTGVPDTLEAGDLHVRDDEHGQGVSTSSSSSSARTASPTRSSSCSRPVRRGTGRDAARVRPPPARGRAGALPASNPESTSCCARSRSARRARPRAPARPLHRRHAAGPHRHRLTRENPRVWSGSWSHGQPGIRTETRPTTTRCA